MKRPRIILLSVAVLLAGLLLAMTTTLMAARPLPTASMMPWGGVEGVLHNPNDGPVPGGWIEIEDAQGQPWPGATTNSSGYFLIPDLPPNNYTLTAYPPDGLGFASSLPVDVPVPAGQTISTSLFLTDIKVSGWVKDFDTLVHIPDAWVVAHNGDWSVAQWGKSDFDGYYRIGGLTDGITYTVEVFPPEGSNYVPVQSYVVTPTTTLFYVFLRMPAENIIGSVKDPTLSPVYDASVSVYNNEYWDSTSTDVNGIFSFFNVPPGEYWVQADPPWESQGLMSSEPFTIVITDPLGLVDVGGITLPYANKVVEGSVALEGTAQRVFNAFVTATRLDAAGYAQVKVDGSGAYTLNLTGGEWHIGVEPAAPPAGWVFAGPPAWVYFDLDDTPQQETVDLEVIAADAQVSGHVVCPGGAACNGTPWNELLWLELRNDAVSVGAGVDANYNFTTYVPAGWYELALFVDQPGFQGPPTEAIYVGSGDSVNVGQLELVYQDAAIEGQITDEFGTPVEAVPVVAWQGNGNGLGWAETDGNGFYNLPVVGGEWFVTADPAELPYVLLNQRPIVVNVAASTVVSGNDFILTAADATIQGIAIDSQSGDQLAGLEGWTWAKRYLGPPMGFQLFSDGPMWDGSFSLKARGNEQYNVFVDVPPQAPYLSGGTNLANIEPGATVPVAVPLQRKNAWIGGVLLDGSTGTPLTGVTAEVYGQNGFGHWASANVDPATGQYLLAVVPGEWSLGVWVDPGSGYTAGSDQIQVTAAPGNVTDQDVEAWPADSLISGHTLQPNGSARPGAFVYVQGYSDSAGYFEAQTESDDSGYFELAVPAGVYALGASLPADLLADLGWLNPAVSEGVSVSPGNPADEQDLQFRQTNATIGGSITFAPNTFVDPTHPAYVWAWSDNGDWVEGEADFSDDVPVYSLDVVAGVDWHVGAVYDDWQNGQYFIQTDLTVAVPTNGAYGQNLELDGPLPMARPLIITFDATTMQSLSLPDGFELLIPPGALAAEGQVTLSIFPTHALRPDAGQPVIGYGYELRATDENGQEITHFNRNVVLTFPYSEAEVIAAGLDESELIPVYYSSLLGEWTVAGSYLVDMDGNQIRLHVDHFSRFGKLGRPLPPPPPPAGGLLFLPAVLHNSSQ